jgi:hypothetical protein
MHMSRYPYETAAQRTRSREVMRTLVEFGILDEEAIAPAQHRASASAELRVLALEEPARVWR